MWTPFGPHMCVRNMGASVFQRLPVEFPVGMTTHTQALQHDMTTILELWLAVCWREGSKSLASY